MKWRNKGHEFDEIKHQILQPDVRYYIWGAGILGMNFLARFKEELHIVGFIDSDECKQGRIIDGLPVISPQAFEDSHNPNIYVLVATGQTTSVYAFLARLGMKRFINYFHIDEVASLIMLFRYNKIYLNNLGIIITRKCTLRCKHCASLIPYYKKKFDISLSDIMNSLSYYFTWVDELNTLMISGGDSMLHPSFDKILYSIASTYYPDKINNIEVYSNAVLPPPSNTLKLLKEFNVVYRFTDYGGLAGKQRIPEVLNLLKNNGIQVDHAKLSSWVDTGYPQESNGIYTTDALIDFFIKCDRKSCQQLHGSKLFFCGSCFNAYEIGYCDLDVNDYFELNKSPADFTERISLLEYNLGFNEKGYFRYCTKCNGWINNNTFLLTSGEQITK